jgi:hypothetical protein
LTRGTQLTPYTPIATHPRLPSQALKAFSKARLLKQRDVRRVGRQTLVTTGLDKVLSEVAVLRRLASCSASSGTSGTSGSSGGAHIVGLRRVLADPDSDDMYLGERDRVVRSRWRGSNRAMAPLAHCLNFSCHSLSPSRAIILQSLTTPTRGH